MRMEFKKVPLDHLLDGGYVQEVNRQFFHPLGLALSVTTDDKTEERSLEVLDYRDDSEGVVFVDLSSRESMDKAALIAAEWAQRQDVRCERLGWVVQPIGDKQ